MMTCTDPRAETLLNLYVDGELPSAGQAELFAHLATCSGCRAQFNALLAFRLAARQEVLPVPPAADEAMFARIDRLRRAAHPAPDRAARRRATPFRQRVPVGTALLAVLVIAALGLLVRPTPISEADAAPAYRLTETVTDDGNALYIIDPGITVEDEKLER